MKLIIAAAALAIIAAPAFAQQANTSQSGSMAGASVTVNGGKSYRQTGAAIAPGLAVGGMSCAGSTSAAAGGPGWGFAFGTTRMDQDCNHRENAKIADAAFGRQVAKRVLCKIRDIYEAAAECQQPRTVAIAARQARAVGYPLRKWHRATVLGRTVSQSDNGWGQRSR